MFRLLRFLTVVALGFVGTQVFSPCKIQAQSLPQQAPRVEGEPDECFLEDNYIDCNNEDCTYRCECDDSCPSNQPGVGHPSCCGTGVDCRCPTWGWLPNGTNWECTGGYSYCCCHDTCCAYFDYGTVGCFFSSCTWAACWGGCAQWGEYTPPPPDPCDTSGYPDEEPQECLADETGWVQCELEQCQYRCECQEQ
jgi:hypothetical protein